MIQPTIQGVKEVASRWWQGEHVVIPTECTYEVCSKVGHVTMKEKEKTATVATATDVVTPHHHIYIVSSSSTPSALYCPPMVRELCFRPRGYAMKTPTMMSVPSTQMTATASEHRHTTATTSTTTVTKIGAARPGTPRTEKKRQPNKKEDSDDTPTSKRSAVSLVSPQLPHDRKTLTLSSVAAASVMPLPPTIASSSGAAYCRRELKQPQPAQHQVHCFSETYHVLKRLAAAIWPGPHIINVAITSSFSPVAAAEALASTTNKNNSSSSPDTADAAAAAGLTITRPDGTSYLALRCPCHPLSMKVARQFYQQQQLTSTTQDHHNSNDGCAAKTISNSNNVMLVGRALAATSFHHEAPSEDDVAQPRVSREFVTEARQAVLGTIPFAYAASDSDTTVSILNGEEQRELFSVPTCEYGQPVPVSLWVDGAKRTVVISRSTTPTTRANAEGTRARGDGATNMKNRTGGCSRITISPTIPLTPENILQAIRQVKASPPASPILAATTPLLARRITSSPSPTSVRSVEGAGATAPSTSNSNSRPNHATTASSSRPVSGTQTTANNDKNDAGKCATLSATACKQQKERLIQAVLCKWKVIVE